MKKEIEDLKRKMDELDLGCIMEGDSMDALDEKKRIQHKLVLLQMSLVELRENESGQVNGD